MTRHSGGGDNLALAIANARQQLHPQATEDPTTLRIRPSPTIPSGTSWQQAASLPPPDGRWLVSDAHYCHRNHAYCRQATAAEIGWRTATGGRPGLGAVRGRQNPIAFPPYSARTTSSAMRR